MTPASITIQEAIAQSRLFDSQNQCKHCLMFIGVVLLIALIAFLNSFEDFSHYFN